MFFKFSIASLSAALWIGWDGSSTFTSATSLLWQTFTTSTCKWTLVLMLKINLHELHGVLIIELKLLFKCMKHWYNNNAYLSTRWVVYDYSLIRPRLIRSITCKNIEWYLVDMNITVMNNIGLYRKVLRLFQWYNIVQDI